MVHLWIVHDNGLPRWELQSTVPLVGWDSFLIFSLKLKTQKQWFTTHKLHIRVEGEWMKNRFVWLEEAVWHILLEHLFLGKHSSEKNLQLVTKLLRVRNKATIRVPFVEPRAAPDFCRFLLPVDRSPYAVVELHVVAPSVCSYNHIFWVWLNWKNKKCYKQLAVSWRSVRAQCVVLPELYVSSSWRESMILKGSHMLFDSTCLQ